jgi:membrane protein implicated in regulation of membrane protease activity
MANRRYQLRHTRAENWGTAAVILLIGAAIGFFAGRRADAFPLLFKRQVDVNSVLQYLVTIIVALYLNRVVAARAESRRERRERIAGLADRVFQLAIDIRKMSGRPYLAETDQQKRELATEFLGSLADCDEALTSLVRVLTHCSVTTSDVRTRWARYRKELTSSSYPWAGMDSAQTTNCKRALGSLVEELDDLRLID